jgi:hypothetical protein
MKEEYTKIDRKDEKIFLQSELYRILQLFVAEAKQPEYLKVFCKKELAE